MSATFFGHVENFFFFKKKVMCSSEESKNIARRLMWNLRFNEMSF